MVKPNVSNRAAIQFSIKSWGSDLADARKSVQAKRPLVRSMAYSKSGGWALIKETIISLIPQERLPYNWESWARQAGLGDVLPYKYRRDIVPGDKEVAMGKVARIAGWFKASANFPLVKKLVDKNTDHGIGCPRTLVNPFRLAQLWSSPGRLNRWLGKVVKRADSILLAYGLRASWASLARLAMKMPGFGFRPDLRPRKAAISVAAETILDATREWAYFERGMKPVEVLKAARGLGKLKKLGLAKCQFENLASLVKARMDSWTVWPADILAFLDAYEEVSIEYSLRGALGWKYRLLLQKEATRLPGGVEVRAGYSLARFNHDRVNLDPVTVYTLKGRQYVYEAEYRPGDLSGLREAIEAWKAQRDWVKTEAFINPILEKGGDETRSVLVTYEAAKMAGFCETGVKAWLAERGFGNKEVLSLADLRPHMADPSAVKVAGQAILLAYPEVKESLVCARLLY